MNKNITEGQEKSTVLEPKTNELGGFYFSSHLKIIDTNTEEVLVQIRGD